ncbi:pre-rRNA-processing protein TSR2 [Paragonimus westermani]|uniref:Pre-rRNA-processing protein TSR2 homolog n=1 Tax=Paragonimus westermani TaxID=34504 RepID=A0A5J4NTL6_9TREM|nr:pre-rRNA-processing protein TSR2 [Paragonimus westermani]
MSSEIARLYQNYVTSIFDSWTVIRICREQYSGGQFTNQKVASLIAQLPDVIRKLKDEDNLTDFLEDYLDDELNAICEDESIPYVAKLLVDGMNLVKQNNLVELKLKYENLPKGCDLSHCQAQIQVAMSESEGDSNDESIDEDDIVME